MTCSKLERIPNGGNSANFAKIAALLLASLIFGCGRGGSDQNTSAEAEHIGKVGQLITEFKSANSGNNPKNIDELKNWAIKNGKAEEKDFISTRDNELYVIEPMGMMRGAGPPGDPSFMAASMPVILHEAKGKNGKKFVVTGSGSLGSEMSDDGLKGLTKGRSDINMKPPRQ